MKIKFLKLLAGTAAAFLVGHVVSAQNTGVTPTNNLNNPGNVMTQNVTRPNNNIVNGSPGAFGVSGVGVTTPANSAAINTTTTNTVSTTTNSTVTTSNAVSSSSVTAVSTSPPANRNFSPRNSRNSLAQRIRNLLASRANMRNENNSSRLNTSLRGAGSVGSNAMANSAGVFNGYNSDQTQTVTFDLTFFEQDTNGDGNTATVAKNSVTDSDIIAALGAATSNDFSSGSKLVLGGNNSNNDLQTIEVQDGDNVVDVSQFFNVSNSDVQVSGKTSGLNSQNGNRLQELLNNRRSGQSEATYSILYVSFDANGITNSSSGNSDPQNGLSFDLNGFNITKDAAASSNTSSDSNAVSADVSGTGKDTDGKSAVIKGTITVSNRNR